MNKFIAILPNEPYLWDIEDNLWKEIILYIIAFSGFTDIHWGNDGDIFIFNMFVSIRIRYTSKCDIFH